MVKGWPDFTLPISITAVEVAAIPIDIKAQTLGTVKIDIATQSLAQVNVNLAASAITLNVAIQSSAVTLQVNIASITGGVVFSVAQSGSWTVNAAQTGTWTINIGAPLDAGGNVKVDVMQSVQLNVNIAASAVTLNVQITGSTITLNVNLAASAITLNVAIQSSAVTLNVNISSQSVDINIKTSGGANIIIDKLTQAAYLERRSTLSNNGTASAWYGPTGNDRRGKFFPRGCRGYIESISAYCKSLPGVSGTITVYIAPYPGAGYIYTGNITIPEGAAEAWRSWSLQRFWNYDSLFIFWVCSSASIHVAYDTGEPYDWYASSDAGATWTVDVVRAHVYATMKGQTVGDLNIAGIVNTIEIPNLGGLLSSGTIEVNGGETKTILSIYGAGEVECLQAKTGTSAGSIGSSNIYVRINVDGNVAEVGIFYIYYTAGDAVNTQAPIVITRWDNTNFFWSFAIKHKLPFKRYFALEMRNSAAAGNKFVVEALALSNTVK